MKTNKLMLLTIGLTTMIHTTGYARYQSLPLQETVQEANFSTQEFISVDYKVFSPRDCKKYFNSKSIIKKGYQPIQVTCTNNSKRSISISPDNFNFRCANAQDVANCLHRNGASRGLGFGIGSLFCSILIIPACVQGCGALEYNNQMDLDFSNKALKNQVIPPFTTINKVIFAPCNVANKNVTLTVKDINLLESFTLSTLQPHLLLKN